MVAGLVLPALPVYRLSLYCLPVCCVPVCCRTRRAGNAARYQGVTLMTPESARALQRVGNA